ncbi:hypothetical protein DXT99_07460 [Pontibacter diazotrophicus]|uniref:Uncharacterized protein n=1 Tax=Pontibacter diazotrophicus TaxID=1400979 RepID=A0A3D8LED9_9BACT|nr:hypothetical protein DXT99_07460 [Pontibacter diazotrophicus]
MVEWGKEALPVGCKEMTVMRKQGCYRRYCESGHRKADAGGATVERGASVSILLVAVGLFCHHLFTGAVVGEAARHYRERNY